MSSHDEREQQRKYLIMECTRDFIIAAISNPSVDTGDAFFVDNMVKIATDLINAVERAEEKPKPTIN